MIQTDFCHATQKCDGCDEETDTGVWFSPKNSDDRTILCSVCCAALLFTSAHHPKRRTKGPIPYMESFRLLDGTF